MLQKCRTVAGLGIRQWRILVSAWWCMLYIRLKMDFCRFRGWKSWLANASGDISGQTTPEQMAVIRDTRNMVALAAKYHIVNAGCLPRSLALKRLLEKQGIQSELKIGLNMENRDLHGHAWLVRGTTVLNDSVDVAGRYPVEQQTSQRPITG